MSFNNCISFLHRKSGKIPQGPKGEAVARAQRLARASSSSSPTDVKVKQDANAASLIQSPAKPPVPPESDIDGEKQKHLEAVK